MSFLQKIQGWSDKKKRNFALIIAIFLTLLIVFLWHLFDAAYNKNQSTYKLNPFGSLSGMFTDIGNEFRAASVQFASSTALLKSELASSSTLSATTSTSTIATSSGN